MNRTRLLPVSIVKYNAFFGDEDSYPDCECVEWKKKLMSCKHMFAVMENINAISWDSFCPQYKNSVFFKIDFEAFGIKKSSFYKEDDESQEIFSEIPLPVYKEHSKASECREIMNQIKALTYTVTCESVLTNLQYHLKEALKEAKSDHGLILNQR